MHGYGTVLFGEPACLPRCPFRAVRGICLRWEMGDGMGLAQPKGALT